MSNSSKRMHPHFSNHQLKNLSLAELLEGIEPSALLESTTAKGGKTSTDLRTAEARKADERREEEIRQAAQKARLSPWKPEAIVLLMQETICRGCGSRYLAPGAQTLMTRFRNSRKPDSSWEVAHHPCQQNPSLPREIKYIEEFCEACPNCLGQAQDNYCHLFGWPAPGGEENPQ